MIGNYFSTLLTTAARTVVLKNILGNIRLVLAVVSPRRKKTEIALIKVYFNIINNILSDIVHNKIVIKTN